MLATSSATLVHTIASRRATLETARGVRIASVLFISVLTAAAAQVSVPVPFTSVPLTLQPMVVLLGGLALGSRLGSASQILYLAAGIAGLPVFAASPLLPPGPLRLLGPTGGYLMAYPLAAFVTGYLAERGLDRRYATSVIAMLAGLIVIYAAGATWLGLFARTVSGSAAVGLGAALATGVFPFVIPDLIKLAVAAGLVPALWRLVGRAR
ncbi:MAG TPA: biotin transporter BioY [Vicinamibacterales bacterium]|nr:biotin transporter BioY [Vicinamibacterales bacterium]